jgi:hypothetical protein
MAIYEIQQGKLLKVAETGFSDEGIQERSNLQRMLREQIEIISPDTMVIAEEFCDWEDSKRRIDLLGLDRDANLVVIELKRTETGGHMELQAIRYASMISTMTFEQVVRAHERYLADIGDSDVNAEESILNFLGWDEPHEDEFAGDVRLVLASAEFSKEITSAVIWLNGRNLDIRCVQLRLCKLNDRLLLDVKQVLPLAEAAEYQIRIREKSEQIREARQSTRETTKYELLIGNSLSDQLSKRELAYRVASEAIKRGATPEQLCDLISWKRNTLFVSVDGEVDQPLFTERASLLKVSGRTFDSGRFFTADDKLFHLGGRTYAFSNQWGKSTLKAVQMIIDTVKASDISYAPSTSTDN